MENLDQNGIEGHGSQVESMPYAQIIISAQKRLKYAATGFLVVSTRCPGLLQDILVFYRKLVEG